MENRFEYKRESIGFGRSQIYWKLFFGEMVISGTAVSVRQAYRRGRKAARRENKMRRLLNKEER